MNEKNTFGVAIQVKLLEFKNGMCGARFNSLDDQIMCFTQSLKGPKPEKKYWKKRKMSRSQMKMQKLKLDIKKCG